MQGNLNEIDLRSILQLISLGQRTGELFIEEYTAQSSSVVGPGDFHPNNEKDSWFVFFLNGQISYAASSDNSLSRLRDYLYRYRADTTLGTLAISGIAATNAPEYGYLWDLLRHHILTPAQVRSIIQGMVQETLFDLLSLRQGSFIFENDLALAPQLIALEIEPLVAKIARHIQEWKYFYPHIQSPDQCPTVSDPDNLRAALSRSAFRTLGKQANGKTSIRQISRYLNRDILTVAKAIYPYVQQGWVQLLPPANKSFQPNASDSRFWTELKVPKVFCIDDGKTICDIVESILIQYAYEVIATTSPLDALGQVFQVKPDLILCDIEMPELNGYEICAMLRTSTAFKQVPIVMLTGKDGFIDRVKARMVGATDYLTKPFQTEELLTLVERYVGISPTAPKGNVSSANKTK